MGLWAGTQVFVWLSTGARLHGVQMTGPGMAFHAECHHLFWSVFREP